MTAIEQELYDLKVRVEKLEDTVNKSNFSAGLACPCCESEDVHMEEATDPDHTTGHYVECHDCGLRTATWSTPGSAREYWDRRAS